MLEIKSVRKEYPGIVAVNGVSLTIQPEETLALVGPSGCGKTTLMRMVAGLETPDSGDIIWRDKSILKTEVHNRNFGLMFQDYALFPHMTVSQNIRFGLEMQNTDEAAMTSRVEDLLKLVGLPGFTEREVSQLSGGEQQRVALARSLAPEPRLLMLDEPLGALDRALRERLQIDLQRILHETKQTTLYVTHDQEEAFSLADRVAVMNKGKIEQLGTPQEIYQCPANSFVAKFIGFDNLYAAQPGGTAASPTAFTAIGEIPLHKHLQTSGILLLRPDRISLTDDGPVALSGRINSVHFRGGLVHVTVQVKTAAIEIHLPSHSFSNQANDEVKISFDPAEAAQILDF